MTLKLSALALVVATGTQLGCHGRALPAGSDRRSFDSADWKRDHSCDRREGGVSIRQEMLQDVVIRILPGKTRSEIEDLLGPSPVSPYFQSTKRDLIYILGPERGCYISIDSEWLLIWLDARGYFREYRISTD